jgi:hypothetical protein
MLKFLILAIFILSSTITTVIKFQRNFVSAAELPSNMPAVFLDPPFVSASPGETFVLSVEVFNLTTAIWQTETKWSPGEDLGNWSSSPLYTYSLGSLVGLDIQLGWDETVLKFVSNVTKIPVEDYTDGVLHAPVYQLRDQVNETHGFPYPQPEYSRYWLSYTHLGVSSFNGNGTVLEVTFEVLKEGASNLNITRSQLSAAEGERIPHKTISSVFRSTGARTRLAAVQVGSIVDEEFFDPALADEDVNVSIQVKNDGEVSDTYNLTLYYNDQQVQNGVWIGQTLDPTDSAFYTYTLMAQDLVRGIHDFKADLSVLHKGELVSDSESKQFRVIDPPQLVIDGPGTAVSGQTILFDASQSSHSDPDGSFLNYTWELWGPDETKPRHTDKGITFTYKLPETTKSGDYRIVLSVKDNFGITYSESRPLTSTYQTEVVLQITREGAGIPWDLILLGVILIAIIGVAVFYIRHKRR